MTSKQSIWPDLCFGKTVLASVHRMDGGRRKKKGKEAFRKLLQEMPPCLQEVAAEKENTVYTWEALQGEK